MTQEEKQQLKKDVFTLMKLAFDDACIGTYEEELLQRIKLYLNRL